MSSQTIIIPNSPTDENLTGFGENKPEDYNKFKDKSLSFVRNMKKTHGPNYDENTNFFLVASSGLFKQLTLIQGNFQVGTLEEVREFFIEGINEYTNLLSAYNIDESQVLVSRYVICTFIDELINTTHFGQENNWSSNSLLRIFHNESYGGENFFRLLDKFLKSSSKHLYILELMYVCISLGFQGKYRVENKDKQELGLIRENLYKQIKSIQASEPMKFYSTHTPSTIRNRLFYLISYPAITISSLLLLGILYVGLTAGLVNTEKSFKDVINKKEKHLTYLKKDNFDIEDFRKGHSND